MSTLTKRQEMFCRKLIECGNQSEAYRFAYNVGVKTLPTTVWKNASALARRGKVVGRMNQLRGLDLKHHIITKEKLTNMYGVAWHMAISLNQPGAAVQATTGLGKLHGLIIERSSVDNSGTLTHKVEGLSRATELLREFKGLGQDLPVQEPLPDRSLLSN